MNYDFSAKCSLTMHEVSFLPIMIIMHHHKAIFCPIWAESADDQGQAKYIVDKLKCINETGTSTVVFKKGLGTSQEK